MYKIDKEYGNLNRKIYIDSNLEYLWASHFTESLFSSFQMLIKFYTIFQVFILGRFFPKYREKSVVS